MRKAPAPEPVDVGLYAANTPAAFWRLAADVPDWVWAQEAGRLLGDIPGAAQVLDGGGWPALMAYVLGEGQFGPSHWRLSGTRQFYYRRVRRWLPPWAKPLARQLLGRRGHQQGPLGWPVEPRFADFLFGLLGATMRLLGLESAPYLHFWPHGKRLAVVLTHDVEGTEGQAFVPAVAALEESLGFRSSFNFVPEGYAVDAGLRAELGARGFEVGVHGLRHDGGLFANREAFHERSARINRYLREWGCRGFRAPLMHRQPEWLQELELDYDSSFFDSDPFEPIAGGTMSLWPFFVGRFVELPYTLVQDHTLSQTLGEKTPRLWLEKMEYTSRRCGMALLNSHPDYLRHGEGLAVYRAFLEAIVDRDDAWTALPHEVARWWRSRRDSPVRQSPTGGYETDLEGGVLAEAVVVDGGVELVRQHPGREGGGRCSTR